MKLLTSLRHLSVLIAILPCLRALTLHAAPPAASATISEDRKAAIEELIAIVNELDTLLSGVKSKSDADAAATRIPALQTRIMQHNRAVIGITPYTKALYNEVQAKYGAKVQEAFRKLENTLSSLQRSRFYSSNDLKKALTYGMSHPYFYNRRLDGTYINPPTASSPSAY
ncbi:hypothetical protein [Akkermansia glycaniphila]|uniref:Uncharacterized protein n=1 Tax=Akkermansia glycaniphila TaxID=1679444 RepID=A0A1H6L3A7_9BACT|nr:hypothetical protein [Akkermansia glycaniphila]SEH82679.1 Hypothetical protein PYTT_1037 [Akkermansia glycaniphila]